jgi:hypothetical protein
VADAVPIRSTLPRRVRIHFARAFMPGVNSNAR